jgi:hypothetical protein
LTGAATDPARRGEAAACGCYGDTHGGLTKRYGSAAALDHLDLEVAQGEVVGYLGPNGAASRTPEIDTSLAVSPHEASGGGTGVPPPLGGVVSVVTRAA